MKSLKTTTVSEPTGCGPLYVHIMEDDNGKPIRVRLNLGKSGSCPYCFMGGIGKLITRLLVRGDTLDNICSVLDNRHCAKQMVIKGKKTYSCIDAIGKAFRDYELNTK